MEDVLVRAFPVKPTEAEAQLVLRTCEICGGTASRACPLDYVRDDVLPDYARDNDDNDDKLAAALAAFAVLPVESYSGAAMCLSCMETRWDDALVCMRSRGEAYNDAIVDGRHIDTLYQNGKIDSTKGGELYGLRSDFVVVNALRDPRMFRPFPSAYSGLAKAANTYVALAMRSIMRQHPLHGTSTSIWILSRQRNGEAPIYATVPASLFSDDEVKALEACSAPRHWPWDIVEWDSDAEHDAEFASIARRLGWRHKGDNDPVWALYVVKHYHLGRMPIAGLVEGVNANQKK